MHRLLIAAAAVIATLSGVAAYQHEQARPGGAQWREIAWPFPRDGWPAGRAFRCDVAACGADVELYVRSKIGFCNCDSGVADDDEVDRVADLDLMSDRFVPREAGQVIELDGMSGRSRSYDLRMAGGSKRIAFGLALSRRCDLLVAVVRGDGPAASVQRAAIDFLGTDAMAHWMMSALDGG
ncbi:MAG: hypothetical protein ABI407_21145 [Bradyrhizobium sp.]